MSKYSSPSHPGPGWSAAPPATRFPAYPASWYLFGRAGDLKDTPVPKRMLGRDLVAYRAASGRVAVLDARCSHLGANLAYGRVVGEQIECPFHGWRYGRDGRCARIPDCASIPPFARQTSFPVVERHGYVFIFNGAVALFPLPFFADSDPADFAAGSVFRFTGDCPWYMTTAHGFDLQHFATVHDRRLLAPPDIDCPAPFARRNRYRAEVVGRTATDRLLKAFAGPTVNASITTWGGTFVVIAADFDRAKSRFLISTQPLENGHTLCEGIVFAKRHDNRPVRRVVQPLALAVRRFFTHAYLEDETKKLRQTRYNPSALIGADRAMTEYFQWLAELPQDGPPVDRGTDRHHDNTPARVFDGAVTGVAHLAGGATEHRPASAGQ
jgi:phenylpropionate dioxygenase-like ring-hydroxylating dioxygenase large terminal subunit